MKSLVADLNMRLIFFKQNDLCLERFYTVLRGKSHKKLSRVAVVNILGDEPGGLGPTPSSGITF